MSKKKKNKFHLNNYLNKSLLVNPVLELRNSKKKNGK